MTVTASSKANISRALALLGNGVSASATAAALGVTTSYISQLLADEDFSQEVIKLRYTSLQKHNLRDAAYDSIEDNLLDRLKSSLPLLIRPDQILKAIQVINGAKRRGQTNNEDVAEGGTVINIVLPTQIVQNFTSNSNNQVIQAGEQTLQTLPSSVLLKKAEKLTTITQDIINNEQQEVPS